jgi:hypothetical protein
MRCLIILLLCCLSAKNIAAQKYLQIEKRNSTKVRRFVEGDVIAYKMKGKQEGWKTEEIQKIMVENNILIMPNGMIKISDIDKLRFERYFTNAAQKSLYTFGMTWAFWKTVATVLKRDSFERRDAVIIGTSLGAGYLIRKLFKYRTMKMGYKRRLRVIDLNFLPVK